MDIDENSITHKDILVEISAMKTVSRWAIGVATACLLAGSKILYDQNAALTSAVQTLTHVQAEQSRITEAVEYRRKEWVTAMQTLNRGLFDINSALVAGDQATQEDSVRRMQRHEDKEHD